MNKEGCKLPTHRLQFTKGLDYKSSGSISICGPGKYQPLGLNINVPSSLTDLSIVHKITLQTFYILGQERTAEECLL